MKPEIKEMWIQALESGEYQQGHRALHPGDNFCCLGVLCDLYRKATGLGKWTEQVRKFTESSAYSGKEVVFESGSITATDVPPGPVIQWAFSDLTENENEHWFQTDYSKTPNAFQTLAFQNDSGHSFSSIANIIREKL